MDTFYVNLWHDFVLGNGTAYKEKYHAWVWEGLFGEIVPADCHGYALAW